MQVASLFSNERCRYTTFGPIQIGLGLAARIIALEDIKPSIWDRHLQER